jgi:hypothetical protein
LIDPSVQSLVKVFTALAGCGLLLSIFFDLFQSVVLPRPAVRKAQLSSVIGRPMWLGWRWLSQRTSSLDRSERRLAAFGPLSLLVFFFIWGIGIVLGYSLVFYGLADQFKPALSDFATSFYVSATTLVPLSYGDFVPEQGLARVFIVAESVTGIGVAAVAITLLFTLYEAFRSREEAVIALDALAGAPPAGVYLLEYAALRGLRPQLTETFEEWRKWTAMVLESHLAYPWLFFFRSSHDNEAWINSFAAIMDAAVLVVSTVVDEESEGSAHLMLIVGNHFVEDTAWVLRFRGESDAIIDRSEYDAAVERLRKAGYRIKEDGWEKFRTLRAKYGSVVNQLALLLAVPAAEWVGDRSYLPHRQRRRRAKAVPTQQ